MNNRGYTLLISVIVSSIVLSIAVFIVTAARKQAILSSVASDSTLAIYAADSAIQCAVQAYSSMSTDSTGKPSSVLVHCGSDTVISKSFNINESVPSSSGSWYSASNDIPLVTNNTGAYPYGVTPYDTDNIIKFKFPDNGTCATLVFLDGYYDDKGTSKHMTVIDARGYNMIPTSPCDSNVTSVNPRLLERQIRLTLY